MDATKNSWKKILPSKKITIIAILGVIAVLVYVFYPKALEYYQINRAKFSLTQKPPEPLLASGSDTPSSRFDQDDDGDGIPNWQEALFGFDQNNRDTDGDGIDDALPTVGGSSIGNLVSVSDTGKLVLEVYQSFQNTPTDSIQPEQVQEVISEKSLEQAQVLEDSLKKYSTIDLTLDDSTRETLLRYQNTLRSISDQFIPDPALFISEAQKKMLEGGSFDKEIATTNSIIAKLLATPVPTIASDIHLTVINAGYIVLQIMQMPESSDELTMYIRSIVVQKNMNLIVSSFYDIEALSSLYQNY